MKFVSNSSFFILHKLMNFMQINGHKTKLFTKMLVIFNYLTMKYKMTFNLLCYFLFIKWRPLLEVRTIKTKTRSYTLGVPVKVNRMYYILFKFYFKQLKMKHNKNFNSLLFSMCINILNNPNQLILNNYIMFNQVYKNSAYLHFSSFINL